MGAPIGSIKIPFIDDDVENVIVEYLKPIIEVINNHDTRQTAG